MPTPSTARTLQDLIDRAAISDTIFNYATGIDRRDWALYRSVFTDQVELDFGTWGGPQTVMAADEWVRMVKQALACFDATQHNMTNHVITVEGDKATAAVHMVAHHIFDGQIQRLGGFYTNGLVRQSDGWKIEACRLTVTWVEGDRGLFERALARGPVARADVGLQGI
jgi:hypothetical protein